MAELAFSQSAEPSRLLNTQRYGDPELRQALRSDFLRDDYVALPQFLSPQGLDQLAVEIDVIREIATRREFEMACMENSPRRMSTVGGHRIIEASVLIPVLYEDEYLMRLLEDISGGSVFAVADPVERHVANFLDQRRDTHGAHFDDYPIALITCIEAPEQPYWGGLLEYVPKARSLGELDVGPVRRAFHRPGDGYLLRADTSAHRVTPLLTESRRTTLNFAYAIEAGATIKTESANLLYG